MNYKKYIGKKVMINDNSYHHARIGILIHVIHKQIGRINDIVAHVQLNDGVLVLPIEQIIIFKGK